MTIFWLQTFRVIHIFSAMERCRCFKPWRDKVTGRTGVRVMPGRCLHYYFYLMDEELGLCFVKVPTWLPVAPSSTGLPVLVRCRL